MEESKNNNKLIIWIAVLLIAVGASVAIFALSSGDDDTTPPATSETQGTSETASRPGGPDEPEIDPDDGDLDTLIATGQELATKLDQLIADCGVQDPNQGAISEADTDAYIQDAIDATSYHTASPNPLSEEIAAQLAELNTLAQSIESKLSDLDELSSSCL